MNVLMNGIGLLAALTLYVCFKVFEGSEAAPGSGERWHEQRAAHFAQEAEEWATRMDVAEACRSSALRHHRLTHRGTRVPRGLGGVAAVALVVLVLWAWWKVVAS